jgi:tRNA U34 5-carboxymethylaminomethyl modifying GTPase MnmE/TrmE
VLLVTSPDVGSWPNLTLPPHVHRLFVLNKIDLLDNPHQWLTQYAPPGVPTDEFCLVSARTGWGITELQQRIVHRLAGESIPPGAGVPLSDQLGGGLVEAAKLIAEGHYSAGRRLLRSLAALAPAVWRAEPPLLNSDLNAQRS